MTCFVLRISSNLITYSSYIVKVNSRKIRTMIWNLFKIKKQSIFNKNKLFQMYAVV